MNGASWCKLVGNAAQKKVEKEERQRVNHDPSIRAFEDASECWEKEVLMESFPRIPLQLFNLLLTRLVGSVYPSRSETRKKSSRKKRRLEANLNLKPPKKKKINNTLLSVNLSFEQ